MSFFGLWLVAPISEEGNLPNKAELCEHSSMMATYDKLLVVKLHGVDKDPFPPVAETQFALVRLQPAFFDKLIDVGELSACSLYYVIDAFERRWLLLEDGEVLISDFDEALEVLVTDAQELQTGANFIGDLVVLDGQGG